MKLVKVGRKWKIEGAGEDWIFGRTFSRKYKAEIATKVFESGGRTSDYWKAGTEYMKTRKPRDPHRALKIVKEALEELWELDPSFEEIVDYVEKARYGTVTEAYSDNYFGPRLHDTWGVKSGGRVHIDIGCDGYHLMLDKHTAWGFVEFIKRKRGVI